ncbi:carcinoembryonic antigen-related cell adhesion molecule 2-like [Pimephales promelas]|nr:carcinoembryonic antigen-related cell adhesion molecule 2-like [Pimephales promelas]
MCGTCSFMLSVYGKRIAYLSFPGVDHTESLLSFSLDAARNGITMRNLPFLFGVLLLVDVSPSGHVKSNDESNPARIEQFSGMNVFVAVADGVKTVIVMEGDSVTLNTNVTEIKREDTILWMFGDDNSIIANMNEATAIFSTKEDERFGDRLELDKQTGSLTIRNIRTEHTGLYQLKIKSTTVTTKRFSVTVRELPQSSHWKTAFAVVIGVVIVSVIGIVIWIWKGRINVSCSAKEGRTRENASKVREDVKQKDDGGTDKERDAILKLNKDAQH